MYAQVCTISDITFAVRLLGQYQSNLGMDYCKATKKVLKYLGLKENSVHKAKDIFNLSLEKVNPRTIQSICKGCIFLGNCMKVGVNKSFQKEINKNG